MLSNIRSSPNQCVKHQRRIQLVQLQNSAASWDPLLLTRNRQNTELTTSSDSGSIVPSLCVSSKPFQGPHFRLRLPSLVPQHLTSCKSSRSPPPPQEEGEELRLAEEEQRTLRTPRTPRTRKRKTRTKRRMKSKSNHCNMFGHCNLWLVSASFSGKGSSHMNLRFRQQRICKSSARVHTTWNCAGRVR